MALPRRQALPQLQAPPPQQAVRPRRAQLLLRLQALRLRKALLLLWQAKPACTRTQRSVALLSAGALGKLTQDVIT
jgi:hypothetical protein